MYCLHCGAKNNDNDVFCSDCGKRLNDDNTAGAPKRAETPVMPPNTGKRPVGQPQYQSPQWYTAQQQQQEKPQWEPQQPQETPQWAQQQPQVSKPPKPAKQSKPPKPPKPQKPPKAARGPKKEKPPKQQVVKAPAGEAAVVPHKRRGRMILIIAVIVVVIAAILAALYFYMDPLKKLLGIEAAASPPASAVSAQENSPQPAPGETASEPAESSSLNTPTASAGWSDWMSALPGSVNNKDDIIEAKTQYRSVVSYWSSDAADIKAGYTQLFTRYGDYGSWREWRSEKVDGSESRQVETRNIYAYQKLLSKQVGNATFTVTTTSYYWSGWMYSEQPVAASSTVRVNKVQQYRYADRQLSYCFRSSDWSEFSDTPISPTETLTVNTRHIYRYMLKSSGTKSPAPSMNNFPNVTDDYTGRFSDVDDNKWYGAHNSAFIGTAVALGTFSANEYMAFRPEENMTIAEAIKACVVINRLYKGEQGVLMESDVWYQCYVDYAIENNLINQGDYTDYTANATRAQAAYIFLKALPWTELQSVNIVTAITDMDINSLYYKSVYLLAQAGIIAWPSPEYTFQPNTVITRAEAAAIVDRLIRPGDRIVNK